MSPTRTRARKSAKKAAATPPAPPRPFTAHHLVPPHELLSEAEGAAALKELGTSIERLPKILVSDPGLKTDPKFVAAREAGEPLQGRLVRIRRPSQTAGEAIAYRVLVPALGE
ncbi:MAG TPA: DNA-directed RNA polymerase subunit RpoH/Rpb5 C-terminal domain-containing protein [Thermoplasmata archaeon]|nr:DNA-directed RNA polymerase subunit RpoH/Rpb5 C-terminal domain-containing protein [Thermoplasmata archaeon]